MNAISGWGIETRALPNASIVVERTYDLNCRRSGMSSKY